MADLMCLSDSFSNFSTTVLQNLWLASAMHLPVTALSVSIQHPRQNWICAEALTTILSKHLNVSFAHSDAMLHLTEQSSFVLQRLREVLEVLDRTCPCRACWGPDLHLNLANSSTSTSSPNCWVGPVESEADYVTTYGSMQRQNRKTKVEIYGSKGKRERQSQIWKEFRAFGVTRKREEL